MKKKISKTVRGYPNYVVYNDGEVYSTKTNKTIKPRNRDGRKYVRLVTGGKPKDFNINTLLRHHFEEGQIFKAVILKGFKGRYVLYDDATVHDTVKGEEISPVKTYMYGWAFVLEIAKNKYKSYNVINILTVFFGSGCKSLNAYRYLK